MLLLSCATASKIVVRTCRFSRFRTLYPVTRKKDNISNFQILSLKRMSLVLKVVVFMAFVHSRLSFTLQNKKLSFGSTNVDCLQMMSDSNNPFAARNIVIPESKLAFSYARCSGPGGQNVNKLNTKAEIRFHVFNADWLPDEVKQRLSQQQVMFYINVLLHSLFLPLNFRNFSSTQCLTYTL